MTGVVADVGGPWGKLHRASCIVGQVANTLLENDEVLPGETLKAAEELILAAMEQMQTESA